MTTSLYRCSCWYIIKRIPRHCNGLTVTDNNDDRTCTLCGIAHRRVKFFAANGTEVAFDPIKYTLTPIFAC